MEAAGAEDRIDRATVLALVAIGLAVLIIANDFTALAVALPNIESDLHSDVSTVQWVINAYALMFGTMIVTGGRLADMFGRRRIFFIGAVIFSAFSLLGAFAQDDIFLIVCRALMGIGGAMIWPAVLGITYAVLPDSKAGLAGGLILGCAGFGNAMGPLFGGFLTDTFDWRAVFLVNLPIAAIAAFAIWRAVPADHPAGEREGIDYRGVAALTIGLIALLLALDQVPVWGIGDPRVIGLLVASALLLVAFVFIERGAGPSALVPRDVLRNRPFASACLVVVTMSAIFFAALLYLPQLFEKVFGYDAVKAGAGLLPMMGTFAIASFVAGPLYERIGPKVIVSAGAGCLTLGIFLLSLMGDDVTYGSLVAGMVVLGLGVGLFYSSITTAAVTALDPSRASLAGGIVYMCQVAGGAVGLGINTAIVASAGTSQAAFSHDLISGIDSAFTVDAALAAVGFVIAVLFVGGSLRRSRESSPAA